MAKCRGLLWLHHLTTYHRPIFFVIYMICNVLIDVYSDVYIYYFVLYCSVCLLIDSSSILTVHTGKFSTEGATKSNMHLCVYVYIIPEEREKKKQ